VAAYERGALAEMRDEHTGGVVRPGRVAALAEAIRRAVVVDRAAARRRAVSYFALDRMVDGYEAVYAEMTHEDEAA